MLRYSLLSLFMCILGVTNLSYTPDSLCTMYTACFFEHKFDASSQTFDQK